MCQKIACKPLEDSPEFKFTNKQIKDYTTVGGTPFLDGGYTVFGEVIKGLSIVDSIAKVATDENDRPLIDVRLLSVRLLD